ncbi:FAD-dependent oxidoreductase [Mycoplasmatota bacterium WC44]
MIKVTINGQLLETTLDSTILQTALKNNIEIPHMCYDERLEAFGGCGMCVVELEGSNKLIRACSTKMSEGMVVETNTTRTINARKTALDMYVSDHRGDCIPPCTLGCPARTDIQGYVGLIANGQYLEAVKLIKQAIPIPASIGRVCPHPCETDCRRGVIEEPISVATLKYFAADIDLFNETQYMPDIYESTDKKIAVIGAGPAGLAAAYFLRTKGHSVTIFEAMDKPGGMLRYGIPEYRLPKDIVDREVKIIQDMGVEIKYNTKLGDDISVNHLQENYDASFLAIGAWKSSSMRCKGEDLNGVSGGIDFLKKVTNKEEMNLDDRVLVIGGGNTAMDVARTCIRLGVKEVRVLYRRTESEMPAQDFEIHEAKEEGIHFDFLVAPTEVLEENGNAVGLVCQKMELGEPDASGRRRPVPIEGEIISYKTSSIIAAIGQKVTLDNIQGIDTTNWGTIIADEATFQTNIEGIFSGGDAVTGPKDAIDAIAAGKNAANVINGYLFGKLVPHKEQTLIERHDMTIDDYKDIKVQVREQNEIIDPELRKKNFDKVMENFTELEAHKEASRCLECGCKDVFECELLHNIREYKIDTTKVYGEEHRRVMVDDHPFIQRDTDKCIQCSQCIRVCDQIIGSSALGLIDRGFEVVVAPEFGNQLSETDCVSCGVCIDVCPTGSLKEKLLDAKEIPLDLEATDSICIHCSLACTVTYHHKGDIIYKVTPKNGVNVLCVKGKFEFEYINSKERISKIKINDTFDLEKFKMGNIGFIVSPNLTNEDYKEILKLGKELNANIISSTIPTDVEELDLSSLTNKEKVELIVSTESKYKLETNVIGAKSLQSASMAIEEIKNGRIKNLILIGTRVNESLEKVMSELDNLVVMDLFESPADVLLPLNTLIETNGTITKIDGELQIVDQVIQPWSFKSNVEILRGFFQL